MNELQALSLNVPVQDLMLNHLMLATLDPEMQREWDLITASHTDTPTTAELVTFLESRCRALELLQTTQSLKIIPATSRPSHSTGSKVSKPSYSNVATQLHSSLCNGSHRRFKCVKFLKMQAKQRLNYAKQSGLCSTACNHLQGTTHIQSKCAANVTIDIILCCIETDILNQMTRSQQTTIDLQMQKATQLQRLTHIVLSRANPEITFSLQQLLSKLRINPVNMFPAEHY